MIHEQRSIDDTIAFLNELLAIDEPAISALVKTRAPCGTGLADHASVQVGFQPGTTKSDGLWEVGLLGVLNGLFGTIEGGKLDGWGPLCADVEPYCTHCAADADRLEAGGWKPGNEVCPLCNDEGSPVFLQWKITGFRRTEG